MTDMPEKIWMHSTQDYHHDSADEAEACEALENFQVYIREDEFFRLLAEERARPQREPACKDSIWVFDNTPEHVKDPEGRYGDWCARPVGKGAMEYVPRAELDEALTPDPLLEKMAEALRDARRGWGMTKIHSEADYKRYKRFRKKHEAVLAEYEAGEGDQK
jgi:hypothetical protein